jgi:hypothetical protein
MASQFQVELGKPSLREDPADSGMALADFPLSPRADERWMSLFATRAAPSAAEMWTVTGESIRLRSPSDADALRTNIALLRQVVAQTTADYNAVASGSGEAAPLADLQNVVDDEFGSG